MVVELGHCANRTARAAHRVGLINGDCGQDAFNLIDHRLIHAVQKLSGVRREGFDVAPLSFCVQGIERQGAFARAAHARYNGQLPCVEGEIEVF